MENKVFIKLLESLGRCFFAILVGYSSVAAACQLEIAKEMTQAYYEDGEYEREPLEYAS